MKNIIFTLACCCFAFGLMAQQINQGEYFFDTDPGVGNGVPISITLNASDSVSPSPIISLGALTPGFHRLVTRFRNTNNIWSMNEARPFYVWKNPSGSAATLVSRVEYFFDTDPGVGNGAALTIASSDSAFFNSTVVQALPAGFHKMVVRFRDNNNVWSMNEARPFYVSKTASGSAATLVTRAEYFFDTDPGVGNGTALTIGSSDSAFFNSNVVQSLTAGFHRIVTRFRDNNDVWSMNEARTIYVAPVIAGGNFPVVAAEYFYETADPGVGKANQIVGFTPGDTVIFSKLISVSGLPAGPNHKVTLRVKNSNGIWGMNETRTFDICNSPALAGFTLSRSGNTITVADTSKNSFGTLWEFGDDSSSTLKNTTHTYAFGGKFNVMLIALNPCGNDTAYQTVNFTCTSPYASFVVSTNGLLATVANYSSGATTYSWNFGDGFTSTASAPSHVYYATGTYKICLTVTNGCGTSSTCYFYSVTCVVPVAQFSSSTGGMTVYYNNQSTNAANIIWRFGDGTISNALSPSHTYNTSGTYTITLVVSNNCGTDSTTSTVTLACNLPVASYIYNGDGLTAQFQNNSSSGVSYHWHFGDGKTSTLTNPTHTYSTTGTYTVCLVAINGCGRDSTCDTVNVCTPPTADFVSADSALTTTYLNESLNGQTYYWTFGNNAASNLVNPVYTYPSVGTYNVCLNVTNTCGTSKICKNVSTSCTKFGAPSICMVTVDSLSKYNDIYWDKSPYAGAAGKPSAVDSFIVYREVSTNVYQPIRRVAYTDSSFVRDTARTKYGLLANGDPNKSTYRYKLQFKDTCGGFSPMSPYHNTIYIVYSGSGQFTWNPGYTIENDTIPVSNYFLFRDSVSDGHWRHIASCSGTQNTIVDPAYLSFPNGSWEVRTSWGIVCMPTARMMQSATVSSSRSNVRNNLPVIVTGINGNDASGSVLIYPNPASNNLIIEWQEVIAADQPQIAVLNTLGMEIMKLTPERNQLKANLNIRNLAAGLYFVEVRGNNYRTVKKVVVQ
jgi:PKD repeat protein